VTPEALADRMRRGDIYPKDRADRALGNFFRPSNLIALREIALRHVAQVVDRSLEPYIQSEIDPGRELQVRERIAVGVSSNPGGAVPDGARGAHVAGGQWRFVCGVCRYRRRCGRSGAQASLQANFQFAENLGAQVVRLKGKNVAEAMAEFVREKHITQVIFGHSGDRRLAKVFVSVGSASVPARCAGGGCPYCEAAVGLKKKVSSCKFPVSSSRFKSASSDAAPRNSELIYPGTCDRFRLRRSRGQNNLKLETDLSREAYCSSLDCLLFSLEP
jgi:hypothetical protein